MERRRFDLTKRELKLSVAFGLLANGLVGCLSFVVPKDSRRVAFGSRKGEAFSGNPKALYLHALAGADGVKAVWMTRSRAVEQRLRADDHPVCYLYSSRGLWTLLRAGTLVIDVSSKDVSFEKLLLGRFTKIQTWHGTPLKHIELDHKVPESLWQHLFVGMLKLELKSYNLIVSSAPVVSRTLRSAMANPRVEVLGYPRNDVLLDPDALALPQVRRLRSDLGLSRYRAVYLYAPTYRDTGGMTHPLGAAALAEIFHVLEERDAVLLFKEHYFHPDQRISLSGVRRVVDVSDRVEDIQDLLPLVDLLITDYSSVVFDFALTGRPMVFFCPDYQDYILRLRNCYYDYVRDFPGPFARTPEELVATLRDLDDWSRSRTYRREYQRFVRRFNSYIDGRATRRVWGRLLEMLPAEGRYASDSSEVLGERLRNTVPPSTK